MSQAQTDHPSEAARMLRAPEPHPISSNFLPLPGPSEIILLARRSVSSFGGYTVGGISNLNFRVLFGCQSIVFELLDNLSISEVASSAENTASSTSRINWPRVPKSLCLLPKKGNRWQRSPQAGSVLRSTP